VVRARHGGKQIVGLYADVVVGLDGDPSEAIDVLNAKNSKRVVLDVTRDLGRYRYTVRDSQGRTVESSELSLAAGARAFAVPVSGLLSLERVATRP
jgi:alpha-galactosidase